MRAGREPFLLNRAHQVDAPARPIILVAGNDVSGAGFQTKPAVNTSENFLFFARENSGERWVGGDLFQDSFRIRNRGRDYSKDEPRNEPAQATAELAPGWSEHSERNPWIR